METKQPEQTNQNGGSRSDAVSGYAAFVVEAPCYDSTQGNFYWKPVARYSSREIAESVVARNASIEMRIRTEKPHNMDCKAESGAIPKPRQRPEVSSSEWVEELAQNMAWRIANLRAYGTESAGMAASELQEWLTKLRAGMEGSSTHRI